MDVHDVDPVELVARLGDIMAPTAIRAAATLRIADHLAAGPRSSADLAAASGAHDDGVRRLMTYLVCRGVFVACGDDRWATNEAGRVLEVDHPSRLRGWYDHDGAALLIDAGVAGLLDAVRAGGPASASPSFWDQLQASPALVTSFDQLMAGRTKPFAPFIARALEVGAGEVVVDVGGGTGILLATVLSAHPDSRGILVDLPASVVSAEKLLADAGVAARATLAPGSFFEPLPEGDVLVLSSVLHDWDDDSCRAILGRCAAAVRPGGRVAIVEQVLDDDVDRAIVAELDLRMLALFGGKERTTEQYVALASAVGLELVETRDTGTGFHVMLLRPSPGAGG